MREELKEAAEIAISEIRGGRSAVILLPNGLWAPDANLLGPVPKGVRIAYASNRPSLCGLRADTLISVRIYDRELIKTCLRMVNTAKNPKWVDMKDTLVIKEGIRIWL